MLAGIDMDLGAASVPVVSFARIPHDAVPAIREALRDPTLTVAPGPTDYQSVVQPGAVVAGPLAPGGLWDKSAMSRIMVAGAGEGP